MDDLYGKFLPQFVSLARSRLAMAVTATQQRDEAAATKVIRELHTLAGEAGLLGLREVVPLARACEQKAKQLHASHTDADGEALVAALKELGKAIEKIGGR